MSSKRDRRPLRDRVPAVYLERRQPVTVLTAWGPGGGPRNVLIQRAAGQQVIRPFRGLRRYDTDTTSSTTNHPSDAPQGGEA